MQTCYEKESLTNINELPFLYSCFSQSLLISTQATHSTPIQSDKKRISQLNSEVYHASLMTFRWFPIH